MTLWEENINLTINFLKRWIEMHLSSLTAWPSPLFLKNKSPCFNTRPLLMIWPLHIYISIYFLSGSLVSGNNGNERRGDPRDDDWPVRCIEACCSCRLRSWDVAKLLWKEDLPWTYANRITEVLFKGWVLNELRTVAVKQCMEFF